MRSLVAAAAVTHIFAGVESVLPVSATRCDLVHVDTLASAGSFVCDQEGCALQVAAGEYVCQLSGGDEGAALVTAVPVPQLVSPPQQASRFSRLHLRFGASLPPGTTFELHGGAGTEQLDASMDGSKATLLLNAPEGRWEVVLKLHGGTHRTGHFLDITAAQVLKIGMILVGEVNDFGWNYNHNLGRLALEEKFGAAVETVYEEHVDEFGPDLCGDECPWAPDMGFTHKPYVVGKRMIEEEGCTVIMATSFFFQDDMVGLAAKYPHVYFISAYGGWMTSQNHVQLQPKIYQARYLAGILAAQRPEVQKTKKVGFVSAFRVPETVRAINAFKRGLEQIDPSIEVLLVWQHSWFNPRKERLVVERLVRDRGVGLMMQHTDSTEPQLVGAALGITGIGYNGEMLYTVGDSVLTSSIMDWAAMYVPVVESILDGTWDTVCAGQSIWQDGAWTLGAISPKVSKEEAATLRAYTAALAAEDTMFCAPLKDNKGRVHNTGTGCYGDTSNFCAEWEGYNCLDYWLLEGVVEACADTPVSGQSAALMDGRCELGALDVPDVCARGEQLTLRGCTPCLAGTYGPGDDFCWPCPEGSYSGPNSAECTPCEAGTALPAPYERLEGVQFVGTLVESVQVDGLITPNLDVQESCLYQCLAHPECVALSFQPKSCQLFSALDGELEAQATKATSYRVSRMDRSACVACPANTFSPSGVGACARCPPGAFAAPGSAECQWCPVGTYKEKGEESCTACPASFITAGVGTSSKATGCVCAPGTFWNRAEDRCDNCPAEAYCPGGTGLPLIYDGYYGQHVGDVSSGTLLAQEEAKASGAFVKDPAAFSHTLVYKCSSASVCPGETMQVSTYGFALEPVLTKDNMRVGFPLEGSCLPNREGIACGRCSDDMYGLDSCSACGAAPLNFVVLFLGPLALLGGYQCAKPSQGRARLLNAFILVSLCGMIVFFIQSLAVLASINVGWPAEMDWLFSLARLFLFDFTGMTFSCWSGNSFIARYVSALLVPLVLALFMAVAFGISQAHAAVKMEILTALSFFGMLMTAFYVTLVKHVVTWFECAPNPGLSTPDTLVNYRDVTCDSSDRDSAVGPMILGLLLYVFGFYLLNVYLAYVAPVEWNNARFRQYARFLVNRWRPDYWWWGISLLTRNLLVASTGLFFTDSSVQLLVLTAVVTLYSVLVGVFQPWVVPGLNTFEIVATLLLALLGTVGLIFNSIREKRAILMQLEDGWAKDSVADLDSGLSAFGAVIMTIIMAFMVLFFGLLIWCLAALPASKVVENVRKLGERQKSLLGELKEVVESKDFMLLLEAVVVHGTDYDRERFDELLKKMAAVAFEDPGKRDIEGAFIRPPSKRSMNELKESISPKGGSVVSA